MLIQDPHVGEQLRADDPKTMLTMQRRMSDASEHRMKNRCGGIDTSASYGSSKSTGNHRRCPTKATRSSAKPLLRRDGSSFLGRGLTTTTTVVAATLVAGLLLLIGHPLHAFQIDPRSSYPLSQRQASSPASSLVSQKIRVPQQHPRYQHQQQPLQQQRQRTMFMDTTTTTTTTRLNMVSYEDLMERLPSPTVIEAVEKVQKQGSTKNVIASDVASAAGVSLGQARKDLTALASLSRGDIAVSTDGELIYKFPQDLKSVLAQNSFKFKAIQTLKQLWPPIFWVVRVSFGVALLASVLAIFSTIFFLQTSSSSSDDRDNGRGRSGYRGGGGGGLYYNSWFGPSPFDVFYYRPYGYYGMYGHPDSSRARGDRDPADMGFLESVFSYIFGDGNPNNSVETRRLQLASRMIRENNGAVTAEQLAPFCDEDIPDPVSAENSVYVDESYVLPIVTALNGEPQVTDDGEIVYVFPDLQVSAAADLSDRATSMTLAKESVILKRAGLRTDASAAEIKRLLDYNRISTRGALERSDLLRTLEQALPEMTEEEEAEIMQSDPTVLQEREWKFSLASDLNKFLAGGLGVVNLGGALYLGNLLNQYALYGVKLPAIYGTVQTFYPLLLGYAVLFNAIPVVRNFWIQRENQKIAARNAKRRKWRDVLSVVGNNGRTRLGNKLQAATRWGRKIKQLGASKDDIIYDTRQNIEDTQLQKEQQQLQEFDKLLETDNNEPGAFE